MKSRDVGFGPRFVIPVLIGPVLNPINTTMIAVALVPIATALDVPSSTVVWLVAGLYLASSIAQPTMGKLADHFGPKVIYLSGLALVAVAGVVPLLFPTFGGALVARVLIGIGTSAAYPAAMTFIRDQSSRLGVPAPQRLISSVSIASLVTTAIGPVLGGLLIGAFGWQAIFAVNVPLALIAFVLALAWLPADSTRTVTRTATSVVNALDPLGMALFAITVGVALVFLLDLGSVLWVLLIVVTASAGGLVWWELRVSRPFIDLRMLAGNPALTRTYARLFLIATISYLMVYAFSQWLQDAVGISSDLAGAVQLPLAIVAGVASVAISKSTRLRVPLLVAALAPIGGGLLVVGFSSDTPLWVLVAVIAIFGLPQGLSSVANQAVLYRQALPQHIGVASGLSRTSIYLGAILASSIIGLVYGERPTDAGINTIGWVVVACATIAAILTFFDRTLKSPSIRSSDPVEPLD
jgi:MFS family permease